MKKMQKIFALLLVAVMLLAVIAGCAEGDPDDRGAHIHMFLGADPSNINFDPALMLFDAETVQWIGLIFEGLFIMDDRGRVQLGMAADWPRITENEERGIFTMEIDLIETHWSDGTQVAAEDFVSAWERILQPDFHSPAAALLFDIKNARAVKEGYMTVADLGLAALDITLLEITFEGRIDYDRFIQNLTSIALVPIRSVPVDNHPDEWAWGERPLTLLSNGPFQLSSIEFGNRAVFDRSAFYRLDQRGRQAIDRYVRPHRLYTHFRRSLDDMATAFNTEGVGAENVFFLGRVPRDRYDEFSGRAEPMNMLSAYTLHFNTNVAPFNNPDVRRALSMAIDRNHIANNIVGLGVNPATGIVPAGIVGVNPTGADFREETGELISPAANDAEARRLLGGVSGSFGLKFRDTDPVETAVAEYIAGVWNQLPGITVTLVPARGRAYAEDILSANYDVMLYDFQAPGVCAFSVLAPFARPFSGNASIFNPEGGYWIPSPHITGFQNDAYDALIEEIFLIEDNRERNERLREAERMLVELMPIAPLYFNRSINISDQRLTGITFTRFGFPVFTRAVLRNHLEFTTTAAPRAAPGAEGDE